MSLTNTSAPSLRAPASIFIALGMLLLAVVLAYALTPHRRLADEMAPIALAQQVPLAFGDWREDVAIAQVMPDPTVQAQLNALYSQLLSRTYVNSRGQHMMLTIAYGSDQSSEATAAHRPEFCYRAQGFVIQDVGVHHIPLKTHSLVTRHLIGTAGNRVEPITYWVTLADKATLPGVGRKLSQLAFGLQGQIADGMLVRVSAIDADVDSAFALQTEFIAAMEQAVPPVVRTRYFGS